MSYRESTPDTASPAQESPIISSLAKLDQRLNEMGEQLSQLDGRLMPLCLSHQPSVSVNKESGVHPPQSTVLEKIQTMITGVEGMIVGIRNLIKRVQV